MYKWLEDKLICPECLKEEVPLSLDVGSVEGEDVLEGELICPACNRHYPIQRGVAVILPEKTLGLLDASSGYNSRSMLSSYLWSHFSDLLKDPNATDAYRTWSSLFNDWQGEVALDIGCSVGRLSFELSKNHSQVIGIDTSFSFIEKARELAVKKRLSFDLIIEGLITEKRACEFDNGFYFDRTEFIVADALALPFPKRLFSTVTSINILEKVESPVGHLADINRVMKEEDAMFVFSDPFSWDESVSDPETWISAGVNGSGHLRGMESMANFFEGKDNIFNPPLFIQNQGNVPWKIRKTENLWEHINSQFMVGKR